MTEGSLTLGVEILRSAQDDIFQKRLLTHRITDPVSIKARKGSYLITKCGRIEEFYAGDKPVVIDFLDRNGLRQ